MTRGKMAWGLAACGVLISTVALAAGLYTNGIPQAGGPQYPSTIPLTGNELIPADTQLPNGRNPATEAISTSQLAAFAAGGPANSGWRNSLIGGDFTTNLFQRGTTSASITTTATATADRWIAWSGTATAMTTSRSTAAADLAPGFGAALKVQRTAAQTGVVPVCVAQVLETADSLQFAGQTAELDFHVTTGANFSSTGGNITAYIGTGTGSDESSARFAFGVNGGGGGGSTWTGWTPASGIAAAGIGSANARYSFAATIGANVTQIGVAICYTPTGTAGANDYFALSGVQLTRNPGLAPFVGSLALSSLRPALSFGRRTPAVETEIQQRYLQVTTETNGGAFAQGQVTATNVERLVFPFMVTMRAIPTCTFTSGGFNFNIAGVAGATGTMTQVTGTTANILTIGGTATGTAGGAVILVGTNTTGSISCSAEL